MIDKVEKIARMKGAVYDVRRREAKDGESGNKKENFKRMLESAMEKNKKNREEKEQAAVQDAYHLAFLSEPPGARPARACEPSPCWMMSLL